MNISKIMNIYLYNQFGGKIKKKWNTLKHNGVLFPSEYISHGMPLICKGEYIYLDKEAEEIATMYAKYIETEYIKNNIFRNNFWKDWKRVLNKKYNINSLDECDFSLIYKHILEQINKKNDNIQKENEDKYKIAIVNGKEQPVGNYRIEPPGIFIGRGCNPKLGKIKKRIYPEDIIINIDKESEIPELKEGHKWRKIIHNKYTEWLAAWRDNITGKIKYVWLGSYSDVKKKNDIDKFDLARKLKKKNKKYNGN